MFVQAPSWTSFLILICTRRQVLMTPRPNLLMAIRTDMAVWKLELGTKLWLERGAWIGTWSLDWTWIGTWNSHWKLELGAWTLELGACSVDWNLEFDLGLVLGTWFGCWNLEGWNTWALKPCYATWRPAEADYKYDKYNANKIAV